MIGALGPVVFSVGTTDDESALLGIRAFTFSGLQRQGAAQYASHDIFGRKPLLEFVGTDTEIISLSIVLEASLGVNPAARIKSLRSLRDSGMEVPLIIGSEPQGMWVMESLSEDWQRVDSTGLLISAGVTVSLREYADG